MKSNLPSGIRDNYKRGRVGDFLKDKIQAGSALSIVSAYFTIYAYEKLKDNLDQIDHLRFGFTLQNKFWTFTRRFVLARPALMKTFVDCSTHKPTTVLT